MYRVIFALLAALFLGQYSAQAQECNPVDFLLQKDTNYGTWTESVKLAFLHVATEEQYKKVQDAWGSGGSYGPISGFLNFSTAREIAIRSAALTKLDFSQDTYASYLQQRLSPLAAEAYQQCLEKSKSSPGTRLWLTKREGDYYTLRAFWVGDSVEAIGALKKPTVSSALEVLELPEKWPKGEVREILVKKSPDVDAYLSINIGGHSKSIVLLKTMPTIPYATKTVVGDPVMATSGGKGGSPNCGGHCSQELQSCVGPQNGGYLVPHTAAPAELETVGAVATATVTLKTLDRVCVNFLSATTARETHVRSGGRASALEVYPVLPPAAPTGAQASAGQ